MTVVEDGSVVIAGWTLRIERGDGLAIGANERINVVHMSQHIVGRDAGLAGIDEFSEGDSGSRLLERCCPREDGRGLAAQLQRHRYKIRTGGLHDRAADSSASGEHQ